MRGHFLFRDGMTRRQHLHDVGRSGTGLRPGPTGNGYGRFDVRCLVVAIRRPAVDGELHRESRTQSFAVRMEVLIPYHTQKEKSVFL